MLKIGSTGSRKTNTLLNLIKKQNNDELIDKIYSYVQVLNEPKYQYGNKKPEEAGMYLNDPKAFIGYSQYMDDVYNNVNE